MRLTSSSMMTYYNEVANSEDNLVGRLPNAHSVTSRLSEMPFKAAELVNGDMEDSLEGEVITLKRRAGLLGGIALIVGTMIGSGIFVSPKGVLERTGSVGSSFLVWGGCGVLSLFGAMCYAELGTMITRSGAEYSYFLEAFGPLPAFLFSWVCVLILKPSMLAIISLSLAEYVIEPLANGCPPDTLVVKLISAITISIITFINCYSVPLAARIQNVFTLAKILAIVIICVGGLVKIAQGHTLYLSSGFKGSSSSFSDMATAFYSALWAYDGWNNLNYVTEELQNPFVNLPLSILIGIPLVSIIYVLVNVSYMTVMSPSELMTSDAVALTWASRVLGGASFIIPVSVALSTLGAGQASTFSGARVSFAAAREGHLLDILSFVHVRKFTPVPSLVFNGVISLIMIIMGNISRLVDLFSFTAWLFYGGTMLALIVMRWTKRDCPRPFKVPLVIPILVLCVSVYLVVAPIVENPQVEYLYASVILALGLIFYFPFVHYKVQLGFMEVITLFFQLLFEVTPTQNVPD